MYEIILNKIFKKFLFCFHWVLLFIFCFKFKKVFKYVFKLRLQGDDWSRKIPVETKVLLMRLLNIESKVAKGETAASEHMAPASKIMPSEKLATSKDSKNVSLRDLFEQKPSLNGKRTEVYFYVKKLKIFRCVMSHIEWQNRKNYQKLPIEVQLQLLIGFVISIIRPTVKYLGEGMRLLNKNFMYFSNLQ